MAPAPVTYTARSKRTEHGALHITDARLMIGGGEIVEFQNGEATGLSEAQARLVATRDDMIVTRDQPAFDDDGPQTDPDLLTPTPEAAKPKPAAAAPQLAASGLDLARLDPKVVAALEAVRADDPDAARELEADLLKQQQAEAAADNGEAEAAPGPPALAVQVPDGFAATTEDGQARCLAAKGDGSQCNNAAVGASHACGIDKHKDQVAALAGAAA